MRFLKLLFPLVIFIFVACEDDDQDNLIDLPATIQSYLDTHEMWSQERMMQAALSLFLLQNGVNQPHVNSLYLDSLFGYAA